MPSSNALKRTILPIGLSLFLVVVSISQALAVGKCESITDLDEKAECYGEKIEDKKEEYESLSNKLDEIQDKKDQVSSTIKGFQNELNITQGEIDSLQADIDTIHAALDEITKNLIDRNQKLQNKIDFRNKVIRNYSKRSITNSLEIFFANNAKAVELNGFQYNSFTYMINKALNEEAVRLIYLLNSEIDSFEQDKQTAQNLKKDLEVSQADLLALKADLDNRKAQAQGELGSLEDEEEDYSEELFDLASEIEELSSKQQAILNQKSGAENGSVGDYEPPSAKTPDPPFSPAFAAFSYGAYTHYNGMSQYGAKGRADDGKDYKEIIKHYYKSDVTEKDDFPDEISVQGYGDLDFQYYLYGIAEMPSDWPEDALKAQAIAARTYAYKTGKPICTTQSCQVFLKSKADNPPSRWKEAVDDTEDMIIKENVSAQYSSTTGGYLNQSGWDVKGSWPNDAYEKRAGSPWFRKAWYTKSYNDNSNCGRAHPWLNEEELADILNAWRVWEKGSSSEKEHISPVTTSCWGGDPYSIDEMREKASKYGTSYDEVTGIEATIGNNGQTTEVKLSTNKGTVTVDGQTFKTVYNLRAPSYISIKSRLFDFEEE